MWGINWSDFTWGAFATLATGAFAVAGAVGVGLRQIKISARQTDLHELALRIELFERRSAVYNDVSAFLGHILRHADYPDRDLELAMLQAIGKASFLFDETVKAGLDDVWKKAVAYGFLKKAMALSFEANGHYGDGNPEKEHIMHLWFEGKFSTLPDLFGDAMRLA